MSVQHSAADFQAGVPGTVDALKESHRNLKELSNYCKTTLAQSGSEDTVEQGKQYAIDALVGEFLPVPFL